MEKRTKYLLDTNIVSHAVNADWHKPESYPHWISRHLRLHQQQCFLPSIAVEEITYGIIRKNLGDKRKAKLERWLKQLTKLSYDEEAARIAGKLRADLARKGTQIEEYDIRIAAIAIRYNLILVTHNVKHFARIPNLNIVNWADSPISAETFIKTFIRNTVRPIEKSAAVFVAFLAYFLSNQPNFNQIGHWLPPYFMNVLVLSIVVGTVLALFTRATIYACLMLSRRHII